MNHSKEVEPVTIRFTGLYEFREVYVVLVGRVNRLPFRYAKPQTLLITSIDIEKVYDSDSDTEMLKGVATGRLNSRGWNTVDGMQVIPPKYEPIDFEAIFKIGGA